MSLLLFLVLGGVAGWIASLMMGTDGQQGILLNVVVGIVGAFIAGWLFPKLGLGLPAGIVGSIIYAALGAVILLVIVGLFRR